MSFPGVLLAGVVLAVLLSLVRPVRADELPPLTGFLLGGRVDAAVAWQLDRSSSPFGEYRVTHGGADALAPFGGGRAGEVGGHDVLYGGRFRF